VFNAAAEIPELKLERPLPDVDLQSLLLAFKDVMQRAKLVEKHHIQRELLSIRERMGMILERINSETFTDFKSLFDPREGRMGIVVTFLATLELLKQALIEIVQKEPFSPLHIKAIAA
jgi:segregation and condensation protein A